jgi:hypothetical protein
MIWRVEVNQPKARLVQSASYKVACVAITQPFRDRESALK